MTPTQVLREWGASDLSAIRDVTWRTWLDAYLPFIPLEDLQSYYDQHYNLEAMERLFRDPDVKGFVAVVDSTIAGSLRSHFEQETHRFYVSSLYILPAFQGNGLGGRLMEMAEQHALTYGVREVWLGVMTQNSPAIRWYKRRGYEFVEELPFSMGHTTVGHLIGFKRISGKATRPVPESGNGQHPDSSKEEGT